MSDQFQFGFVTIVGKPNVGKSTFVNQVIGQKISITSHRPQTTRHRILGILTEEARQIVFVDTPGIHSTAKKSNRKTINKVINRTALSSLDGVDVACFMINADGWKEEDLHVLKSISDTNLPIVLLINKLDRLKSVNDLLPLIEESSAKADFAEIIPISALKGSNVDHAVDIIGGYLPNQQAGFDEDQITDRSFRFLVSELLREQLFRRLGDELPYATAVEVTRFEKDGSMFQISADIWVDRPNHKAMVIGKQGATLKQIGASARKNIEELLDNKVFMELWVKVRSGWSDNARDLHALGYDEDNF